jgi:predicted MFS family arabinose efflux permease
MFGPLVANVLREVPDDAAGLSGGLFSTVQQLALALGVVIIGAVFTATRDGLGSGTSFALCIAIDAFAAIVFLVLALRLRVRRNVGTTLD